MSARMPVPVDDPHRIRHERCALCGDDLARLPEMPCPRCGTRYHAECLMASGCVDTYCTDPLQLDEARLPAPLSGERLPAPLAPKASCSRRMAAVMLDTGLALTAAAALSAPAALLGFEAATPAWIGAFLSLLLNDVTLMGLTGASVGKRAMGIRVTDREGENPGFFRALLREMPGKFLSQAPWMLGYALAAVDPETRALHDRVAGTWVVEEP